MSTPASPIVIIDFRTSTLCWGHNCSYRVSTEDPQVLKLTGWSDPKPKEGEYLLIGTKEEPFIYNVLEIEYPGDPRDIFFATCRFVGVSSMSEELRMAAEKMLAKK